MIEKFLRYLREEGLYAGGPLLLGVSGGMDSMAMMHLFSEARIPFGVAHCNFGLRNEESDEDERFVRREAEKLKVRFHSTRFDTLDFARRQRISVQMAARELRYAWFEEIREAGAYADTAVAHHLNDLLETMLINLVRGTGLAGLHGILPRQGRVVRPLLCFTREEIEGYVKKEGIPYREESSNSSDKYMRNRLRHHVVPVLKELNPSVEHSFAQTARHIGEIEQVLEEKVREGGKFLRREGESWILDEQGLRRDGFPPVIVYELLKPFGFPASLARDIAQGESQPGKQFYSQAFQALRDRGRLIISPLIQGPEATSPGFGELFETRLLEDWAQEPEGGPERALLDYDKLHFPLSVRTWKEGDRFRPLGMKGHKKLSDFFIDLKVPRHLKHRIPLLISGQEIAWVAGFRISETFKVAPDTRRVLEIRLKENAGFSL